MLLRSMRLLNTDMLHLAVDHRSSKSLSDHVCCRKGNIGVMIEWDTSATTPVQPRRYTSIDPSINAALISPHVRKEPGTRRGIVVYCNTTQCCLSVSIIFGAQLLFNYSIFCKAEEN